MYINIYNVYAYLYMCVMYIYICVCIYIYYPHTHHTLFYGPHRLTSLIFLNHSEEINNKYIFRILFRTKPCGTPVLTGPRARITSNVTTKFQE